MKKLLVLMSMLIVIICQVYPAQSQKLEQHEMFYYMTSICRPSSGEKLYSEQDYQIQWCQNIEMSGNTIIYLFTETDTQVASYPGVENDGIYMWTVPDKLNGNYKIKIGNGESDIFEIIDLEIEGWDFKLKKRFERFRDGFVWFPRSRPDPGCPMCGTLDIGKLLDTVSPPAGKTVRLAIYRGGKLVTKLGNFGEKSRLPRRVDVRFSKADYKAMKQGGNVFELRVMSIKGKLLHSRKISIKMGIRKK